MRGMVMLRRAGMMSLPLLPLLVLLAGSPAGSTRLLAQAAAPNRIDTVAPMAPELASYGAHDIGVRTLRVTDPQRIDVLKTTAGGPAVRMARFKRSICLLIVSSSTVSHLDKATISAFSESPCS